MTAPTPTRFPAVNQLASGFPSPAQDYLEPPIDLNRQLVEHPAATFFVRAHGRGPHPQGIQIGDVLIVDRALKPLSGRIVIGVLDGEFIIARLLQTHGAAHLEYEGALHPIGGGEGCHVWGVVTYAIHQLV